ncbi:MAG: phenylacetate--CoA ligase family protein [Candidatus Rokuibacteriota bacterium]
MTASAAEIRAAQEASFQRLLDLCFAAHPYYRRLWSERGIRRESLRGLADLPRLPLTPKDAYMADPDAFRLRTEELPDLPPEERTLAEIVYTTGTTDRPAPFYGTTHDQCSRIYQLARMAEIAGIRRDDVVVNLFPLTAIPHQGFLSALYGTLWTGAKLVAPFTGRPRGAFPVHRDTGHAIDLAVAHRATILWGIGSYVRRVVQEAETRGADLSSVRLCLVMGEGCPPGMRDDIRRRLHGLGARDVVINNGYGFTEIQGPAPECREGSGFHLAAPTEYAVEILEPESLCPQPDGAPGLVVLSHLNRRGTVLLRYVVGDVSALTWTPCPHCGFAGPRFTLAPQRTGALVKVKGTLVNLAVLHDALLAVPGLEEHQIVLTKSDPGDPYSADTLLIRAAVVEPDRARVRAEIHARVRAACEVTVDVGFVGPDHFADGFGDYKFPRFVDERPAAARLT